MKRLLRLSAAGAVVASALAMSVPAQAQSAFSFGFSDRGSHFSMGVNDPYYRPYYDYGPRYYRPGYYDYRPYPYRPYRHDRRVQVYDPYLGRYVWVWR